MRTVIVFAVSSSATLVNDSRADHIADIDMRGAAVVTGSVRDRSRYKSAVPPVPVERYRPRQALF